ncbi:MAG: RES family NAD+ phosphorylase [Acidobacteriota bacterium]|nr:RES family NAD+ phosphorylase [Acidobacteriota bacterium]
MARPKPHPDPPANLSTVELPITRRSRQWFRAHRCRRHPLFFGRTGQWRYDDPNNTYGVLYVAADFEGAFIEGCLHDTAVGTTTPLLSERYLRKRCVSKISFAGRLKLVDLSGPGLAAIGADARLCVGDYRVAQRWSRALWSHPRQPDGILYLSRHNPSIVCAAVFDRAPVAAAEKLGSFLGPRLIHQTAALLDAYSVGLC